MQRLPSKNSQTLHLYNGKKSSFKPCPLSQPMNCRPSQPKPNLRPHRGTKIDCLDGVILIEVYLGEEVIEELRWIY